MEFQQHFGVSVDLLFEALGREVGEMGDRSLAAVEHHVPNLVVDVRLSRLEQISSDVPGFKDPAADHRVEANSVHDPSVEVLDYRISALQSEENDMPAAAHR